MMFLPTGHIAWCHSRSVVEHIDDVVEAIKIRSG